MCHPVCVCRVCTPCVCVCHVCTVCRRVCAVCPPAMCAVCHAVCVPPHVCVPSATPCMCAVCHPCAPCATVCVCAVCHPVCVPCATLCVCVPCALHVSAMCHPDPGVLHVQSTWLTGSIHTSDTGGHRKAGTPSGSPAPQGPGSQILASRERVLAFRPSTLPGAEGALSLCAQTVSTWPLGAAKPAGKKIPSRRKPASRVEVQVAPELPQLQ